jgi:pyruvate dehydrogenase E2 component (dihydrolipoyllysine-residue acetyltransferase)
MNDQDAGLELERPSAIRRAIAAGMSLSAAVPQFTLDTAVDCAALFAARESAGRAASVSDLLVAACARALVDHPDLNSAWTDDGILRRAEINIGTALALDEGLVVPVIQRAEARSLDSIGEERQRLDGLARHGALRPDDIFSGTFTISNLGTLGVRRFRALVQPGQAAILAVGSIAPQPAVVAGELAVRPLMSLAVSCDHRVVDGAPAARFLGDLVARLEDSTWLAAVIAGSSGEEGGAGG